MALVRNATAKISESGYRSLVEKSRALTGLQEPLARRPDMPPQLAASMCDWVSDALKGFITSNYRMTPIGVQNALGEATRMVKIPPPPPKETPAESAQKLIDKLAASGQLKQAHEVGRALLRVNPTFSARKFAAGHAFKDAEQRRLFGDHLVLAGLPE